jgi:hypothetical protein
MFLELDQKRGQRRLRIIGRFADHIDAPLGNHPVVTALEQDFAEPARIKHMEERHAARRAPKE